MTIPRKTPVRRISRKREAANQQAGIVPFSTILGERKPVKKANPERQVKRAKGMKQKHAAYMRSQTRKDVEARSGGRCEALVGRYPFAISYSLFVNGGGVEGYAGRCENKATDHHHLNYNPSRYGGNELPGDVAHVCKSCHRIAEALKPHKGGRLFRGSGAREGGA